MAATCRQRNRKKLRIEDDQSSHSLRGAKLGDLLTILFFFRVMIVGTVGNDFRDCEAQAE